MITPPWLQNGDKAGICAPAGKVSREDIEKTEEVLKKQQLKVIRGNHLFFDYYYFAGTDQNRLEDLQAFFDDPEIKLILVARGGYGITRIVDKLDLTYFKKYPKWVVGFSDITALHGIIQNEKIQSIHGIMATQLYKTEAKKSLQYLNDIINGKSITYSWPSNPANIPGSAKGLLTGGNLSLLENCIGTSSETDWNNKILFIEEIDEPLYKIDRILIHFKRTGKLKNIAGLLVGYFTGIKDSNTPFGISLENIILEKVKDTNIPVAFGFPAGHNLDNMPLILNCKTEMNISEEKATLTFENN